MYGEVTYFHTFPEPAGWIQAQDFPGRIIDPTPHGVFTANGNLFTVEGFELDIWGFNPELNTWVQTQSRPDDLVPGHHFPFEKKSYFAGDQDANNDRGVMVWAFESFGQGQGTWSILPFQKDFYFPEGFSFVVHERGYVFSEPVQ